MSEQDPQENASSPPIDPLTVGELLSLPDAAAKSGFSHSYFKEIAKNGKLKAKKIGNTWLTTIAAVEEYKKKRSFINIPKKYRDRA